MLSGTDDPRKRSICSSGSVQRIWNQPGPTRGGCRAQGRAGLGGGGQPSILYVFCSYTKNQKAAPRSNWPYVSVDATSQPRTSTTMGRMDGPKRLSETLRRGISSTGTNLQPRSTANGHPSGNSTVGRRISSYPHHEITSLNTRSKKEVIPKMFFHYLYSRVEREEHKRNNPMLPVLCQGTWPGRHNAANPQYRRRDPGTGQRRC